MFGILRLSVSFRSLLRWLFNRWRKDLEGILLSSTHPRPLATLFSCLLFLSHTRGLGPTRLSRFVGPRSQEIVPFLLTYPFPIFVLPKLWVNVKERSHERSRFGCVRTRPPLPGVQQKSRTMSVTAGPRPETRGATVLDVRGPGGTERVLPCTGSSRTCECRCKGSGLLRGVRSLRTRTM